MDHVHLGRARLPVGEGHHELAGRLIDRSSEVREDPVARVRQQTWRRRDDGSDLVRGTPRTSAVRGLRDRDEVVLQTRRVEVAPDGTLYMTFLGGPNETSLKD